ncbi:hypothetical protein N9L85_04175 [Euryarchaeota archaeon]|nr:hypothetical protein [Euryarchaeota archaeon]
MPKCDECGATLCTKCEGCKECDECSCGDFASQAKQQVAVNQNQQVSRFESRDNTE